MCCHMHTCLHIRSVWCGHGGHVQGGQQQGGQQLGGLRKQLGNKGV